MSDSAPARVDGRRWTRLASQVGNHSRKVIFPSRGSVHLPRSLSASTVTRNFSASALRR